MSRQAASAASRRGYTLRARAESAAQTRLKILDAARELLLDGPVPSVSTVEIAKRSGVARSTVYSVFGSRGGLMAAMFEDVFKRSGFAELGEVLALPNAVEAMRRALEHGSSMYARASPLVQRLLLVAQLDQEAALVARAERARRAEGMKRLARRLADEGHLRPGVTAEGGAAILWLLTSFETFDQLYSGWKLPVAECSGLIVDIATDCLMAAKQGLAQQPSRQQQRT